MDREGTVQLLSICFSFSAAIFALGAIFRRWEGVLRAAVSFQCAVSLFLPTFLLAKSSEIALLETFWLRWPSGEAGLVLGTAFDPRSHVICLAGQLLLIVGFAHVRWTDSWRVRFPWLSGYWMATLGLFLLSWAGTALTASAGLTLFFVGLWLIFGMGGAPSRRVYRYWLASLMSLAGALLFKNGAFDASGMAVSSAAGITLVSIGLLVASGAWPIGFGSDLKNRDETSSFARLEDLLVSGAMAVLMHKLSPMIPTNPSSTWIFWLAGATALLSGLQGVFSTHASTAWASTVSAWFGFYLMCAMGTDGEISLWGVATFWGAMPLLFWLASASVVAARIIGFLFSGVLSILFALRLVPVVFNDTLKFAYALSAAVFALGSMFKVSALTSQREDARATPAGLLWGSIVLSFAVAVAFFGLAPELGFAFEWIEKSLESESHYYVWGIPVISGFLAFLSFRASPRWIEVFGSAFYSTRINKSLAQGMRGVSLMLLSIERSMGRGISRFSAIGSRWFAGGLVGVERRFSRALDVFSRSFFSIFESGFSSIERRDANDFAVVIGAALLFAFVLGYLGLR